MFHPCLVCIIVRFTRSSLIHDISAGCFNVMCVRFPSGMWVSLYPCFCSISPTRTNVNLLMSCWSFLEMPCVRNPYVSLLLASAFQSSVRVLIVSSEWGNNLVSGFPYDSCLSDPGYGRLVSCGGNISLFPSMVPDVPICIFESVVGSTACIFCIFFA